MGRHPCPCCGAPTLTEEPPGTHQFCVVCCWEDDADQFRDPDREGGVNRMSLNQARTNFRRHGKCYSTAPRGE